jgi:hypothetical protein
MAFAKLSGSLLESDARPARAPEQAPVPAPPGVEERVAPAVDRGQILERLARLANAAPLYDSLWELIRSGDQQGVARVVAELVGAGRSVSEISELVESLSTLIGGAGPEPNEKPDGGLDQPGAAAEFEERAAEPAWDEMREAEAVRTVNDASLASRVTNTSRETEPAIDMPLQAESEHDTVIWREPCQTSPEPPLAAEPESRPAGEQSPEFAAAFPSPNRTRPPSSGRAYLGAALAVVIAIAAGGAFLVSQSAVKQVGATAALPADTGANRALNSAEPRPGGVGQAPADSRVTQPAESAKSAPLPRPAATAPAPTPFAPPAAAVTSAAPPIPPAEPKKVEPVPATAQTAGPALVTAPTAEPAAMPAVPVGTGRDGSQPKSAETETEPLVKVAAAVPSQPIETGPVPPEPTAVSANTPLDRLAAQPAAASPVVASLEPPKNSPAATTPSSLAPPISEPVTAAVHPNEPPAMLVDTAPLLERGDRLFGTGDVASARLFYERAADAGNGQAALRLGETYDPGFLQRAQLRVAGDRGLAVFWYGRARELGADEADILLKGIQSR